MLLAVHLIYQVNRAEGSGGAYSMGLEPASVRPSVSLCVSASTLSNISISETSWLVVVKFHHWGGGLTALGFGLDQIRILVSMATDSSHRVIYKMWKIS